MYTDGPSEMDLYEFVLPCVSLTKKKFAFQNSTRTTLFRIVVEFN